MDCESLLDFALDLFKSGLESTLDFSLSLSFCAFSTISSHQSQIYPLLLVLLVRLKVSLYL
ncbi:hypothetical protein, partial [Helicobacter cinaedi]|uniref:hypothetical protein n=1 Tax=Helicobacter cinaedi TaxID=213 RepID=UPI001A9FA367